MAQSKKGKVVQLLTPENYIRKMARSLPLYECLVASGWEESGLPTVVIARKHTTGNITASTYLVDLGCLGVKDTSYLFNVTPTQYSEFKDLIQQNMELIPVDYALVHNIILAGVEYAEEWGFQPYKDYESITRHMLEEDDEAVELMEIECGYNGMPVYVQGPYEDEAKARRIIAQLEKSAGSGNFKFFLQGQDWKDLDPIVDDKFSDLTFEQKKDLFLTLSSTLNDVEEMEDAQLLDLVDSMISDLVDEDLCNQYYDQFWEELDLELSMEEIPDELLGIRSAEQPLPQQWKDQFMGLFKLINKSPKKAWKELELFKKQAGDLPAVHLIELLLLQKDNSAEFEERIQEQALRYPDYPLLQLTKAAWQVTEKQELPDIPGYPHLKEKFFAHRNSIHPLEYYQLLTVNAFAVGVEGDLNKIEALMDVAIDLGLPQEVEEMILATNAVQKIKFLANYIKESGQQPSM